MSLESLNIEWDLVVFELPPWTVKGCSLNIIHDGRNSKTLFVTLTLYEECFLCFIAFYTLIYQVVGKYIDECCLLVYLLVVMREMYSS